MSDVKETIVQCRKLTNDIVLRTTILTAANLVTSNACCTVSASTMFAQNITCLNTPTGAK